MPQRGPLTASNPSSTLRSQHRSVFSGCSSPPRQPPAGVAGRPEPVAADQRTGQQHKRKEAAGVPIPADLQPSEAAQPGQRPLHPPAVAAQPLRRLDPAARDPGIDPTPSQIGAAVPGVIPLVRVDCAGPAAPPTAGVAHRRHVVHQRLEHGAVVDDGRRHRDRQRQATAVADQVEFGAGLATIDGICANMIPPRLARTLMVSTLARDHSSPPSTPSRSSTSRWS
jgi:hypothetical protein